MRFFMQRRLLFSTTTCLVVAGLAIWADRRTAALESTTFTTGWILLCALFFLASLQIRKRLYLPTLGSVATWLQVHIYVALAAAAVFLLHVPWRVPNGILEGTLAALFLATTFSGILGLYWSRTAPSRLARAGEEFVYEQIPMHRRQLRDRAQAVVLGAVRETGESTLGEFYERRLGDFFAYPRRWRYRLRPTTQLRKALLAELTEATRYLSDAERKTAEQLFALIRKRDDLDFHEALQWRLKSWLLLHICLTYPLLAAACLHGWLAYLFTGHAG